MLVARVHKSSSKRGIKKNIHQHEATSFKPSSLRHKKLVARAKQVLARPRDTSAKSSPPRGNKDARHPNAHNTLVTRVHSRPCHRGTIKKPSLSRGKNPRLPRGTRKSLAFVRQNTIICKWQIKSPCFREAIKSHSKQGRCDEKYHVHTKSMLSGGIPPNLPSRRADCQVGEPRRHVQARTRAQTPRKRVQK